MRVKRSDLEGSWREFEAAGPGYALPVQRLYVSPAPGSFVGNLYGALYPRASFRNLIDFNLFQVFSSSIQQDLIETGSIDMEWFYPEEVREGVARFWKGLPALAKRLRSSDLRSFLAPLSAHESARWLESLEIRQWEMSVGDGELELTALTEQGYLTMFVVDG